MRTFLSVVVSVLLLGAAPAAAGWSERTAARPWVADCLRTAGPDMLATVGAPGPATLPSELLGLDGSPFSPRGTTTLGWLDACPAVAATDGQPPLLAALVYEPGPRTWSIRAANGGGAPQTLRTGGDLFPPAAVLAPSGAAVVAWFEREDDVSRLLLAVRPQAGAPFGAAHVVASRTRGDLFTPPALGVDAAGTVTVAWQASPGPRDDGQRIRVATVAPDGGLAGVQTLMNTYEENGPALAVAPDGGALVVADGPDGLELFERRPGATAFSPAPLPGDRDSDGGIAVSLASGGAAVIADRTDPRALTLAGLPGGRGPPTVVAWTRPADGAFSPPQLLTGSFAATVGTIWGSIYFAERPTRVEPPGDPEHQSVGTALAPDGSVLVTWVDRPTAIRADRVRVARGSVHGGFGRAARIGGDCRAANAAKPFVRRDGSLAVAWSDNADVRSSHALLAEERGGGRIGLATLGAPAAPARRPSGGHQLLDDTLEVGEPLRLRVRCEGAPCDVRVTTAAENVRMPLDPADPPPPARPRDDGDGDRFQADRQRLTASTTLAAGAAGELRLTPLPGYRVGFRDGRPAPLRVTVCPAGGPASLTGASPPRVSAAPQRPLPWLRDVRLRRLGDRWRLTWRTAVPARRTDFRLLPIGPGERALDDIRVAGRARSRFAVSFAAPATLRSVTIMVRTDAWGWATDEAEVKVRRQR